MEIKIKGNPFTVPGKQVQVGEQGPDFSMKNLDDKVMSLGDFKGKTTILSVVPDIDTRICALQTKRFNQEASRLPNINLVTISTNTKEEQGQWCAAEGVTMTMLRDENRDFGKAYGLYLPENDINVRALIILDKDGQVIYEKINSEVSEEPDYEAALKVANHN